ncbi:MAG: hypothetical protein WBP02_06345 [Gammaproteobacteria bacterium]|jgi:hypothetical protein
MLLICTSIISAACVQPVKLKGEGYVLIRSNYPILYFNGEQIEPAYRLDIEAGENTVVIVYNTYQHDYYCTFSWTAVANAVYEVTDQENQYPLTLYRWVRTNSLWASRLDPVDPLDCIEQEKGGELI